MGYFDGSNPKTNAQGVLMSSVEKYQRLMAEAQKRREEAALKIGVDEANLSRHNERFDQETKLLDAAPTWWQRSCREGSCPTQIVATRLRASSIRKGMMRLSSLTSIEPNPLMTFLARLDCTKRIGPSKKLWLA